jgi:hypothetical protein
LPAIYRRFGFVETGTQSAEVVKNATRPIHFITMSKSLENGRTTNDDSRTSKTS